MKLFAKDSLALRTELNHQISQVFTKQTGHDCTATLMTDTLLAVDTPSAAGQKAIMEFARKVAMKAVEGDYDPATKSYWVTFDYKGSLLGEVSR